ncbi:hypothetical protein HMPREF2989_11330 [Staphylococcus sp. HMSC062B11]|nr:hypothetical protein [Staphylococcus sp. HMSC062B11]OFP38443.1 hypothetical protein HMPREF2989_11330 [Staphylococcus sp. HMSC062B11]
MEHINKDKNDEKSKELDKRLGINGYYKTDLDLEIEKELLESPSESSSSVAKRIRIISLIPLIILLILAFIRIIRTFI